MVSWQKTSLTQVGTLQNIRDKIKNRCKYKGSVGNIGALYFSIEYKLGYNEV